MKAAVCSSFSTFKGAVGKHVHDFVNFADDMEIVSRSYTDFGPERGEIPSGDMDNKAEELSKGITKESTISKRRRVENLKQLQTTFSFKDLVVNSNCDIEQDEDVSDNQNEMITSSDNGPEPEFCFASQASSDHFEVAAAVKLQKCYKSYRTRRNLADCAVVIEELWWKALDFAALERSSVSFFDSDKSESAVSKWARAKTRAAKVGKGLSKAEKAQKLALRHWLEAIDPRHRYGHNLNMYYDVWFKSQSSQPFFYWLDVGDGKEVNLEKCSRNVLQWQCVEYLGPNEREAYEVTIRSGRLAYKQSQVFLDTPEGSKWIFVLSTSRKLYVGKKRKGYFQHSSFLAGGATIASGRLVAHHGNLKAIWPYSGHYCPTKENLMEFIRFLEEHQVDLTNVENCAIDDDVPPSDFIYDELKSEKSQPREDHRETTIVDKSQSQENTDSVVKHAEGSNIELGKPLLCKWTTGAGARIGCVREYPAKLQVKALEQVNLSPRTSASHGASNEPIPSPRPSPKVHLSPRLVYMGLSSPRVHVSSG